MNTFRSSRRLLQALDRSGLYQQKIPLESVYKSKDEPLDVLLTDFNVEPPLPKPPSMDPHLKRVVEAFPPISFAMAYGSGIFKQAGYDETKKPMLDFVFGVNHARHWHWKNLKQHPHHYSSMKYLGTWAVDHLQNDVGAGVYYNTNVEVEGVKIKYGVMELQTLINDLLNWDTMYIAGRMQKPIKVLQPDFMVGVVNRSNKLNALRTSLLLLPQEFTSSQLFETITSLSYMGDFRTMIGAENPNKIRNIVSVQKDEFDKIYLPLMLGLTDGQDIMIQRVGHETWKQNMDPMARAKALVTPLPKKFQTLLVRQFVSREGFQSEDEEALYAKLVQSQHLADYVKRGLRGIVGLPALTQSAKGILTAGVWKSAMYSLEKLKKGRSKT